NWHAAVHDISYEDAKKLKDMDEVDGTALTRSVGYSMLEESINEYKPYLYLVELSEEAFETWPIHLVEGRLPLNDNEVLISEHIISNGGVKLGLGGNLNLDLGNRVLDGEIVYGDSYFTMEDGTPEELDISISRDLTIVGVMNRLSYRLEGFSSPGYTIVTLKDFDEMDMAPKGGAKDLSVYFTATNSRKVYDTASKIQKDLAIGLEDIEYNSALLRTQGVSDIDGFNAVLYSLGAILILLIMLGSISLIYNSFSISVSERTKQFGLLSSVGATTKQVKHSIFFEAMFLAAIGIPLGLLAGIFGIGVTLYFVNDILAGLMSSLSVYVSITLSVSPVSVVIAAIIALITILISAHIPARRATKISAVEAIRQSTDIKLKSKQVKSSALARKLLGIEANLALKNMKRNKKRYRSTVISLFVSVVLFVSASGFSMYLTDSVMNVYEDVDYDLYYFSSSREQFSDSKMNKAYENILALDSVKQGSSVDSSYSGLYLQRGEINKSSLEYNSLGLEGEKGYHVGVDILAVDQDTFTEYINSLGLDESQFADNSPVSGIVIDRQHYYDYEQKRYLNTSIFKDKTRESLSLNRSNYSNGDEKIIQFDVKVAAFADTAPFGIGDYSENSGSILLIINEDSKYELISEDLDAWWGPNMFFKADDPYRAEEDIKEVLEGVEVPININNIAQSVQESRKVVTIISIFAYGFIVLISLIA
ncbi:MAG TPA: ABC transporter permease, partial [Bacillota bacterium]|nr:ABC transporter permease [Bacillota bacterium]